MIIVIINVNIFYILKITLTAARTPLSLSIWSTTVIWTLCQDVFCVIIIIIVIIIIVIAVIVVIVYIDVIIVIITMWSTTLQLQLQPLSPFFPPCLRKISQPSWHNRRKKPNFPSHLAGRMEVTWCQKKL